MTTTKAEAAGYPVAAAAAAALTLALWSGTAIANKLAVGQIDAMTAGLLRSLLAGLIAAGIASIARFPLPKTRPQWVLLLISGIFSFALWPGILSVGISMTTANHAALIMAVLPVTTGLIAAGVDRKIPSAAWWIGIFVAMIGTVLLILWKNGTDSGGEATIAGDLIILAGVGICSAGYVAGGKLSAQIGTWSTTFWGLAAAVSVLLPSVILLAPRTDWSAVGMAGWGGIAYMTFCSSIIGYACWFWALGSGGIARIGVLQFGQPVLTLVFAVIILGEQITLPLLAAGAIILIGVAIAQRQKV